ncbi:hypothetical protein ACS0TY_004981 [Phlomoides rotata]
MSHMYSVDYRVLSEYPEAKMASELQVSSLGEAFQDLVKRLDDALQIFDEGPPFTLQRICEVIITGQLFLVFLALDKGYIFTSSFSCYIAGRREYRKTRSRRVTAAKKNVVITDVGCFESVELSVLLCNDEFIQKLNKDWRGEDHATDVLSMSKHIPELKLPILMLGDIVISVETVARQAEERGHTLIDEIRILMVHGLLHLIGFNHELSHEAEKEMENEEEFLLKALGWKGKGLIHSAYDSESNGSPQNDHSDDRKRVGNLRFYKPKFGYIFCDIDGTLLNSKSQISLSTAQALKEASSRGVKVVIATGKTRPTVMNILNMVNLTGKDGIIYKLSPGVFVQGLLVYGRQGREIFRRNLDPGVCSEAFMYSLEHKIPIIAFAEDRCFSLFEHPLVDSLHTVYHEPKAEIIPSVDQLLAGVEIQKLLSICSGPYRF